MTRFIALLLLLSLSGCGSQPYRAAGSPATTTEQSSEVRESLLLQYREWQGVPYQLGGAGKEGVDCSAFTQLTFRQRFGAAIPRTTLAQARLGRQVELQQLLPGDLLFYRSRVKLRHVGIYMGNGEFLHASTSRGVMISSLNNPYWREHFWQARRLTD